MSLPLHSFPIHKHLTLLLALVVTRYGEVLAVHEATPDVRRLAFDARAPLIEPNVTNQERQLGFPHGPAFIW